MIRALRPAMQGRPPFLPTPSTSTSASPFQRLRAPGWRAAKKPSPASSVRSLHSAKTGAAAAPSPGLTQASAFIRGPQAWANFATSAPRRLLSRTQKRNFNWSWSRRSQTSGGANGGEESLSLSGRLRKLSREYGWSAVGVYLALSVLDFPFCFLLVKWAGTDRIGTLLNMHRASKRKMGAAAVQPRRQNMLTSGHPQLPLNTGSCPM